MHLVTFKVKTEVEGYIRKANDCIYISFIHKI